MHLSADTNIGSITSEEYCPVILEMDEKKLKTGRCRYYKTKAQLNTSAVIFVGESGEGGDNPSRQSNPRLSHILVNNNNDDKGISSLRVKIPCSADFDNSVVDVIVGIDFLVCYEKFPL
jgi:hypothetical protein